MERDKMWISNSPFDNDNKIIKTTICSNCKKETLNHYVYGYAFCGWCMTLTYEIKKKLKND